jgi:hypothetical protein
METRIKITYLDFYSSNRVLAKTTTIYGYNNLYNKISELGIDEKTILRIERVLVAAADDNEVID